MRRHTLICRFDTADRTRVAIADPDSMRTVIHFVSGERRFDYGLGSLLERLAYLGLQPPEVAFDLVLLAALVFCADTRLSRETESQDGWTREIDLYLPVADTHLWAAQRGGIEAMLRFLTGDQWRVFFRPRPRGYRNIAPRVVEQQLPRFTCASLFSGGLDSYIGAIDLVAKDKVPLLVSHHMEGMTKKHQDMCLANLEREYGAEAFASLQNYVCFKSEIVSNVEEDPNQRARSFLFFGLGALAASGLGEATLYIPENGLISLNVPLDPLRLGALSTRTTHPYFMARYNDLLAALGGGYSLQDEKLKDLALPQEGQIRDYDPVSGSCRLIPEHGVVLVVTDEGGCETCFGFFRFPGKIVDIHGKSLVNTGLNGAWAYRDFVNSPDPRYREIVRMFAESGYPNRFFTT